MIALLVIAAVVVIALIFMYNSLINKRNQVENAWANIDVQLKKRSDLIPNLVSSAKQYMQYEEKILTQIVDLRNSISGMTSKSSERLEAESQLSGLMGQFAVTVENYPDLKASNNFQMLMRSLNEVEAQLSASRRAFNAAVLSHNNAVQMFPTNIMASAMAMKLETSFQATEAERQNVNVDDLFNA